MGIRTAAVSGFAAAALVAGVVASGATVEAEGQVQVTRYDWRNAAGYNERWGAGFGPGEGVRTIRPNSVTVDAHTFTTGADFSVFDHLKYIRISNGSFAMPEDGSLQFSVDITADTSGTDPNRDIVGCYGPSGAYGTSGCTAPFSHDVLEGQQAGVVLNMVNFATGQLFDWFVSDNQVFALIERLPSNVTGVGTVGLDRAYTQIVKVGSIKPGRTHNVAIRYTRDAVDSYVEYFLDGKLFVRVDHVGIPLDKQPVPYTGYAPSLGNGEELKDELDSFVIGHGLFSLLDAFPYQHPDAPELSVSIPVENQIFGQGAIGTWANFKVTTINN
jgi:hypothetical protein